MLCPECHEAVGTIMGGGSWKDPAGSATGSAAEVASDEEDPLAVVHPPCFAFCSRQKGRKVFKRHWGRARLASAFGRRETAVQKQLQDELMYHSCMTNCTSFEHES